tara:strand:+ start:152550 stop:152957 length:408 start_codon:yes stop_codon:yes gene_type:complete
MNTRQKKIVVTIDDYQRLSNLLKSDYAQAIGDKPYLTGLRSELAVARIVESEKIGSEVVTMNSKVRLVDLDINQDEIYTLVYPDQADIAKSKLSILTPIGTAILGFRVGDVLTGLSSRIRIEEVIFQPEREGIAL